MKWKNLIKYGVFLIVSVLAYSFSIYKFDDPVWIAAWLGPLLMIRFVRTLKWPCAMITSFIALHVALNIGLMPFSSMMDTTVEMNFLSMLGLQVQSGMIFIGLISFIPLVIDKAMHKRVPKFLATLIFPTSVIVLELINSLLFSSMNTFGETQYHIKPFVMVASYIGVFGISFLVTWFASVMNLIWEEQKNLESIKRELVIYFSIMILLLTFGGIQSSFTKKADHSVMIAGISLEVDFMQQMAQSGLALEEFTELSPQEYSEIKGSPESHFHELYLKTLKAARAGIRIVVWQEFALTIDSTKVQEYLIDLRELAQQENIYLLFSFSRIIDGDKRLQNKPDRNSGIFITPSGEIAWEYAKAYPNPGWESAFVESGEADIPYIDTPYGRIGQVICADMLRPDYLRQAHEKEIDLLLVPSYDAPVFSPLFTYSSAYRAVENGFTMVMATGDGHSSVIDPYYRQWAGQNTFELEDGYGNFYAHVPIISKRTFYGRLGYLFPYAMVGLLLGLWLKDFIKRRRNK